MSCRCSTPPRLPSCRRPRVTLCIPTQLWVLASPLYMTLNTLIHISEDEWALVIRIIILFGINLQSTFHPLYWFISWHPRESLAMRAPLYRWRVTCWRHWGLEKYLSDRLQLRGSINGSKPIIQRKQQKRRGVLWNGTFWSLCHWETDVSSGSKRHLQRRAKYLLNNSWQLLKHWAL